LINLSATLFLIPQVQPLGLLIQRSFVAQQPTWGVPFEIGLRREVAPQ
jgi:hypothetical protein